MSTRLKASLSTLDHAISCASAVPLDALRDVLSASYTLLFDERVDDRQVEQAVVDGAGKGYGLRLQSAAAERMLPGWLRDIDEGLVVDRAALVRDRDFSKSAFFDYVIRPEGRFHCLIATPYVTPTRRYHLIVGRPQRHEEFGQADISILSALLPYVARLISLTNDAAVARSAADTLASAFDRLSNNVVILSDRKEVEFTNAGAKRLLALRDGLHVEKATLHCADMASTILLARAIAAVQSRCGPEEASVHLPRPSGRPPLHAQIHRMPAGPLSHDGRHRAMLIVEQTAPDHVVEGWSAGKHYGLTARELDLAVTLAKGRDLRTSALTLGISYQTARSHLRSVFAKTDIHRQSDLIRAVLRTTGRQRW